MENSFSTRLLDLRKERRLTQEKLALATKISQTAISNYEANLKTPSIDVIIVLCKFFQVSAGYLIGLED